MALSLGVVSALLACLVAVATAQTVDGEYVIENRINKTSPVSPDAPSLRPRIGGRAVTEAVIDLISQACIFEEDNLFLRRVAFMETSDGNAANAYGRAGYYGGLWQVDRSMFDATQANTAALRAKYAAIYDAFGIDWMTVQWTDLQKPLYSGLAAALYVYTQGRVPTNLEQQGTFVNSHYHDRDTAFNYTRLIDRLPVCGDGNDIRYVDVAFMLDGTVSADDFLRMRKFTADVVGGPLRMNADPDGNIRFAVYQFGDNLGASADVQRNIGFNSYSNQKQLVEAVSQLSQSKVSQAGSRDVGMAVKTVVHDAFGSGARPLSAKLVIVITDKTSNNLAGMLDAAREAQQQGVGVMALGVGGGVDRTQLDSLVTYPACRHHVSVGDFRDLQYFVQLVQRTICNEPMIATGMVHCQISKCRNVAFPIFSNTTTLIANVTCDHGRVYVTTRMPRPGRGFEDFTSIVDAEGGATYVTIDEDIGKFIFADLFPMDIVDPTCIATLTTVNGAVGRFQEKKCEEWQYPDRNPCLTPNRTKSRFPYSRDQAKFIQCDLQNKMYLTECPPGESYFSAECEVCVGGPDSPFLTGCGQHVQQPVDTPYCGLKANPCTPQHILAGEFYFACPFNDTTYLQCNTWGHAFVMRCPEHEVWRQHELTCEYLGLQYNPCGTPGVRYYPYPPDPAAFIDCGDNMVSNLKYCPPGLVWNSAVDTCDYPKMSTSYPGLTHLTQRVTFASRAPVTDSSGQHYTADPVTGLLARNHAYPCTQANINANRLYHPYSGSHRQYIQCDMWGDSFLRNCQSSFTFNPLSSTCVDGPIDYPNTGVVV